MFEFILRTGETAMSIASDVRDARIDGLLEEVDALEDEGALAPSLTKKIRRRLRAGGTEFWCSMADDWDDRDVVLGIAQALRTGDAYDRTPDVCEMLSGGAYL